MSLWLDDRTLDDLVYQVLVLDGHLAPMVPVTPAVALANAPAILGSTVSVGVRRVVVTLDVRPASITARDTLVDSLWRRIGHREKELRAASAPTRALRVVCADIRVELYTGAHAQPACAIILTFDAQDPRRVELQPQLWTLSSTRRTVPIGTELSAARLWLYGNATPIVDPVVTVRRFTGEAVLTLTLTGVTDTRLTASLGANNALVIDSARQSIEYYVSGVRQTGAAHGLTWLGGGQFPVFSPEDCAAELSAWGTMEVTAASGTPTGLLAYHRAY